MPLTISGLPTRLGLEVHGKNMKRPETRHKNLHFQEVPLEGCLVSSSWEA
jgi:hypothetical protein